MQKEEFNIMLASDSYKFGHYKAYMPNTKCIYSYLEARKGAKYNKTLWFGLQSILKKYLEGQVVTDQKIREAKAYIDMHLGRDVFNEKGWRYILDKHNGQLPILIKSVEEGRLVDVGNVLMTVENTDPEVPWLTNYLETILMQVWYPTTVATQDWEIKKLLEYYLNKTACNKIGLPFMLHGFGMRAATSYESCELADAAHLINFKGTDTVPALKFICEYYGKTLNERNFNEVMTNPDIQFPGYSVFATEHSIMTSRGEEGEWDVLENIFKACPNGIMSIVIDSYNYQRFIDTCGVKYRENILNRDGKTVFRPDSGDPVSTTLDVLERLDKHFGSTLNSKNFKVLNPKVGVLWGDGIDYVGIRNILFAMFNAGWAAENIVFGMGGHMVQSDLTRDTMRFAFKCSAQYYDDAWHDVWKKPLDISKASKRGRLALIKVIGGDNNIFYKTIRETELKNPKDNRLQTVFRNGSLYNNIDFDQLRSNAVE